MKTQTRACKKKKKITKLHLRASIAARKHSAETVSLSTKLLLLLLFHLMLKKKNNPTETSQSPAPHCIVYEAEKKKENKNTPPTTAKPITQLNKLHKGKKKKKKKKNTYRRLPTLTFPVITIHILSFNSLQLPEVAVTLKQSILHSLTDFIMPPNLFCTQKSQQHTPFHQQNLYGDRAQYI